MVRFQRFLLFAAIVLTLVSGAWEGCDAESVVLNNTQVEVYFSPDGGCTNAIVDEIDSAKS